MACHPRPISDEGCSGEDDCQGDQELGRAAKAVLLGQNSCYPVMFVTDDKVPVDECDEPDLLCIGQEQHMAFYGPIGCLRRRAIADCLGAQPKETIMSMR